MQVPYESLGPELSDSYEERSRIFYVAKLCNMAGQRSTAYNGTHPQLHKLQQMLALPSLIR